MFPATPHQPLRHPAMTRPNSLRRALLVGLVTFSALLSHTPAGAASGDSSESHGAWTLRCENRPEPPASQSDGGDTADASGGASRQCFIFQNVVMKQSGQRVVNIAIGFLPGTAQPIAVLTLPLGISLPPGARLMVEGTGTLEFLIERCVPAGCRAGGSISPSLREAMSSADTATVAFQDGSRQDITVDLSLEGFADALVALESHR